MTSNREFEMSVTIKSAAAIGLLVALGACGGSSGSDPDPWRDVETVDVEANAVAAFGEESGLVVTRDGDVVTVSDRTYGLVEGTAIGRIAAYESTGAFEGSDDTVLFGRTRSGTGEVRLIHSTLLDEEILVVELERTGPTTVPITGTSNYSGDYLGQFFQEQTIGEREGVEVGFERITGTVTLTANFDDPSTTEGRISNRQSSAGAYADIILQNAFTDPQGPFGGDVTGGEGTTENVTVSTTRDGNYSALFTGAAASEVIGGLSLVHDQTIGEAATRTEVGVFIAERRR